MFLVVNFFIFSLQVFSQQGAPLDGISFAKKILGKPIVSLTDSLECLEGGNAGKLIPVIAKCTTFRYDQPGKQNLGLGNVVFKMVLVSKDSLNIIDNVSLMKIYSGKGEPGTSYKKTFRSEYRSIQEYLQDLFRSNGKKDRFFENDFNIQENTKWLLDGFVIILTKDTIKKRPGVAEFFITSITIMKSTSIL
jgi:hypothetical protein